MKVGKLIGNRDNNGANETEEVGKGGRTRVNKGNDKLVSEEEEEEVDNGVEEPVVEDRGMIIGGGEVDRVNGGNKKLRADDIEGELEYTRGVTVSLCNVGEFEGCKEHKK